MTKHSLRVIALGFFFAAASVALAEGTQQETSGTMTEALTNVSDTAASAGKEAAGDAEKKMEEPLPPHEEAAAAPHKKKKGSRGDHGGKIKKKYKHPRKKGKKKHPHAGEAGAQAAPTHPAEKMHEGVKKEHQGTEMPAPDAPVIGAQG